MADPARRPDRRSRPAAAESAWRIGAAIVIAVGVAACRPVAVAPASVSPSPTLAGSSPSASGLPGAPSMAPSPTVSAQPSMPPSSSPFPSPSISPSAPPSPSPIPSPTGTPVPTLPPLVPVGFTLHVPILTYHLIATPEEATRALPGLVVPPALFDAHLTALAAAGWQTITLGELSVDLAQHVQVPPKTVVITIDDGRDDGATEALPILLRHGMVATYFVIAGRIGLPGYLDASQVSALATAGMEIGDHSMFHVDLNGLAPAALSYEIRGPLEVIYRITGARPTVFAYPFGDFDSTVISAVHDAGLTLAVSTRFGAVEAANLRYEIPRIHIGPGVTTSYLLALLASLGGG